MFVIRVILSVQNVQELHGRYSIPYCTEGGTVGFFCSFFLEGDYLPSGSAFESAARRSRQTHFIILNTQ